MRLIKPSFEIWEQPAGLKGTYKQIEHVGRVCYKSEDKITEDSAKPFVDRMIKSQHYAMLEHGTVCLMIQSYAGTNSEIVKERHSTIRKYIDNSYSKVVDNGVNAHITTNYRVLVENGWLDDLKYLCEPTEFHEKRITVHFVCDRGVSHEYVRHRVFSFAQESTRYCNYSKDKFGNELTFIEPCWDMKLGNTEFGEDRSLIFLLNNIETEYNRLIKDFKWTPQQARMILPNCLKTELVMTGFVSNWQHFFDLRALGTTGAPHPQAKELAEPLMKEFIARKYINN